MPDPLERLKCFDNVPHEDLLNFLTLSLDSADNAIFLITIDGDIQFANSTAQDSLAGTGKPLTGKSVFTLGLLPADTSLQPLIEVCRKRHSGCLVPVCKAGVDEDKVVYKVNVVTLSQQPYFLFVSEQPASTEVNELPTSSASKIDLFNGHASKELKILQQIIDHSPAVVYVKGIDGRYAYINEKYLTIFGFSRTQVLGKDDFDLLPANVAIEVTNNDKIVIASKSNITVEEEIQQTDGVHTYISEKFPLFDDHGNVVYLCGISTDISEQRESEENLKQAQKMDALGKLSAGIAHDMNNIFGIISGHAELIDMNDDGNNPAIARSNLQITNACERGAQLVERLTGFSRTSSAELQVCNVNHIIEQNAQLFKRLLTANIDLQFHTAADLWECQVDKSDFENALLNLLVNAKEALFETRSIIVETKNVTFDKPLYGAPQLEGEYVQVSVIDSGQGIKEDTLKHVFDPFFTTKGKKNSGLGLSQVYGFLQRCQADIQIESHVGKGTRVTLFFPRAQTIDFDIGPDQNSREASDVLTQKSIYVVDDEPELATVMQAVLSAKGYRVTLFDNAHSAIAYSDTHSIDLLITDVVMPHMDGLTLATTLRDKQPELQVLFISGYADRLTASNTCKESLILLKPFSAKQLVHHVAILLGDAE